MKEYTIQHFRNLTTKNWKNITLLPLSSAEMKRNRSKFRKQSHCHNYNGQSKKFH